MLKYLDRKEPRLKPIHDKPEATLGDTDNWYSWLINDWIPNEPDSEELMKLFIGCGFNVAVFVGLVVDSAKSREKLLVSRGFPEDVNCDDVIKHILAE